MALLTMERGVAKIKAKDSVPPPLSVKLPADIVESARIVAALRAESISDLLGNILRPILAKMEREEIAKRTRQSSDG